MRGAPYFLKTLKFHGVLDARVCVSIHISVASPDESLQLWHSVHCGSQIPLSLRPAGGDSCSLPSLALCVDASPFLGSQGFYVALRLVACAQSGHEVTLSNLSLSMPPPKFVSVQILLIHVCPVPRTHVYTHSSRFLSPSFFY